MDGDPEGSGSKLVLFHEENLSIFSWSKAGCGETESSSRNNGL